MKRGSLLLRILTGAAVALLGSGSAQADAPSPLAIARQGYLFAGGQYSTIGDQQVMTRVYWSWSADGAWNAPSGPRYAFARYRALYKLYVIPNVLEDDTLNAGYAVDFLKVFIPELDKTLFGKSDNSAAP